MAEQSSQVIITYYPHTSADFAPMPRQLLTDATISDHAKLLYLRLVLKALETKQPEVPLTRAELAKLNGTSEREVSRNIKDLKAKNWIAVQRRYKVDTFQKAHQEANGYAVFASPAEYETWKETNPPVLLFTHEGHTRQPSGKAKTPINTHECHPCQGVLESCIDNQDSRLSDLDSSVFTNVHTDESARTASGDARTSPEQSKAEEPKPLSLEAQAILEALKVQGLITRFSPCFKQEFIEELVRAGKVEPGFGPDKHTIFQVSLPAPHPDAVDAFKHVLQETFLDGTVPPAPSNGHAAPAPTPAALPEVPEGYGAVYGITRHLVPNGKSKTLCGLRGNRFPKNDGGKPRAQCPGCTEILAEREAKAAARKVAATGKASKPKPPAIFSDERIFEAIGAFSFNATGKAELSAVGGRVGPIRKKLCQYVIDKLGYEPTPEETEKLIARLAGFGAWYDKACEGCSRPATADTFVSWWVKYVASGKGSGNSGESLENGFIVKLIDGVKYRKPDGDLDAVWEVAP